MNPFYFAGPYAHLFHSVHEQNYVAHVIAYAAKIGDYDNSPNSGISNHVLIAVVLYGGLILLALIAYK